MRYHFIGIGGSGMAPLANILIKMGEEVTGSDIYNSSVLEELSSNGAKVYIGHKSDQVAQEVDIVVVTSAIPPNNPEILKATEMNKKIIQRSELLGLLMGKGKGIAVAGTHGKTTTSSLLSVAFMDAGMDPTSIVGGIIRNIGKSYIVGSGDYIIAEACEYKDSFLNINPYVALITNIEPDHLDYFGNIENINKTFSLFVSKIHPQGFLVINGDDLNCLKVSKDTNSRIIKVGFGKENDVRILNFTPTPEGVMFTVSIKDKNYQFTLGVFGKHNVFNASCVIAIFYGLGIDMGTLDGSFSNFSGAGRRLEKISDKPLIYDDYGHHPTEISATYDALKQMFSDKKVCLIFQPHQYSRTRIFLNEFASALSEIDEVIIKDIYEARDSDADKAAVSVQMLVSKINENKGNSKYIPLDEDIVDYITKNRLDWVIVTMGAGDINRVGYLVKERVDAQ
jgi:UDP-N-acetylmuramate--alanine ligase